MSDLGRFTWYELLTTDPAAAREFYTKLMGFGHTVWEGGENPYHMLTVGDAPTYGILQLPAEAQAAGAPSHWLGYVHVPDRDAAVDKAVGLGANKLVSLDIPEVGGMAVLSDPQGAVFAMFQPEKGPEAERDPGMGEVGWHELATGDYEAAFDFYATMFGWDVLDDMDMGEYGTYRIFGRNGRQLGGMWNKPDDMPVSAWLYYLQVPDIERATGIITELGGNVLNGPMEVPGGGQVVQATDPTGAMFALFQPPAGGAGEKNEERGQD